MGERVKFTAGRVEGFKCPEGVAQAFLWDTAVQSLALRVTANGARAYVFQSRYAGQTVRITIGSPKDWSIDEGPGAAAADR